MGSGLMSWGARRWLAARKPDATARSISALGIGRRTKSPASAIPPRVDEHRVAVRYGHFYAYRLIRDLGLLERGGVVRTSMVHYNTPDEVEQLIEVLDPLLD